jgi:hypothetical protein
LTDAPSPSTGEGDEPESGATSVEVDPLVGNGLSSPLCDDAPGSSGLTGASRRNCETSGFVAAEAPTGDYGIDVHIDTGVLGLSSGGLLSAVQELFVTPLWMALVWAVHALVVMLEWCFTIDLLDSASVSSGVGATLRRVQATFTVPWLALVLAIGSMLAVYNGLIRRRVAETLGQALLTFAMMAAGIWVTLDPVGTVGALGDWANQASLGTLAVSATGVPSRAGATLANGVGSLFAETVEVPWCYLEFGDVAWCRDPARLDPRLRAAALSIASGEMGLARCKPNAKALHLCAPPGSAATEALEHSALLLRSARTNGAVFLALPANASGRNSINDRESLLWAICRSDEATSCRGPSSAEAEFRTNRGTWARVGGLLLIVAGVLGMLLMIGFIALRLLAAALFGLLYLMLAPAAVLAPALGEGGRAIFRRWGTQLLGAVVSKLVFSFLLGAVLAVLGALANLETLGWWTQWLLMSAFWWGAFARRHQALQLGGGVLGRVEGGERRSLAARANEALEGPRRVIGGVRDAKERLANRSAEARHRRESSMGPTRLAGQGHARRDPAARAGRFAGLDDQVRRTLAVDHDRAQEVLKGSRDSERRLSAIRERIARIDEQRDRALVSQDTRRAARLLHRGKRLEAESEHEQARLDGARRVAVDARNPRGEDHLHRARQREQFLDAQAALPSRAAASGRGKRDLRDYASLAGLAGYGRDEYEGMDGRHKRVARLEIDRELAARFASSGLGRGVQIAEPPATRGEAQRTVPRGEPRGGRQRPASTPLDGADRRGRARHDAGRSSESIVMRDAREVAARRKRQLGPERP